MNICQKKVVIFGGTGFIGTHLLRNLTAQPNLKVLWTKRPTTPLPDIPNLPAPRQFENLETVSIDWISDADVIIDLASSGRGRAISQRDVLSRVSPHLRIIDGLLNVGSKAHYIFLSSGGAIYGNDDSVLLSETARCIPQTEYGLEKLIIESALLCAAETTLTTSILRVSNAYGIGQTNKPGFGVIPTLVKSLEDGEVFKIFGSAHAKRDYVNVLDILRAIDATIKTGGAGIVNIATGKGTSIAQLIALLEELTGRTVNVEHCEPLQNEPNFARLDISRAKNVLGWEPQVSLREGLAQLLKKTTLL
ncbi:NAD-dependent epimerase/dehydratase family protein [Roseibium sediminicola]|uniref:NAD-dependent epimerase/dehydratase family protein n=1 Tax=Roseibium sediminicola TaxID=2933272 RepID=A0ABT0H3C7_9HYPH|nr:NAD-dependent epimerase/dehydratase family protein [Roseibium sp. CAU 1639]MCK7616156.1 NAD-dependent epimerase/dehydratase family protein [Roseibium sp. CAU 1639]